MAGQILTKSAFKVAQSCSTKLYYYLRGYPSSDEQNEYLELLATGGFIIGELARLLFPEGVLVDVRDGMEHALAQTEELLKRNEVVIFEATFLAGKKLVSTDILVKRGDTLEIIEVKSKAFDSDKDQKSRAEKGRGLLWNAKGGIAPEWSEYLSDVAFQYLVVKEAKPEMKVSASLLLPDKAKTSKVNSLWKQFTITRRGDRQGDVERRAQVTFNGDSELIRRNNFLTKIPVDAEVRSTLPAVEDMARSFVASIEGEIKKIETPIGKHCKGCEFRTKSADEHSGFKECWGGLGDETPHVFDLYYGTAIKDDGKYLVDELIREGKASLFDVPQDKLSGIRGERQRVQISHTLSQKEWVSKDLGPLLQSFRFPLHFIDFETTRAALPWYEGMHPFDQIAFQWSCHTLRAPDAVPEHSEWINEEDSFPNERFASTLLSRLGGEGTVFTWARHELMVLNDIEATLAAQGREEALRNSIRELTAGASLQGRLVDMNEITQKHYFHPMMKGKTSLKSVLPSIWNSNAELQSIPWLSEYYRRENGELLDPYKVLPPLTIEGVEQAVREGTGAMIAYENLIRSTGPAKKMWKNLLLQYCKLDTLAMVVVWLHWIQKTTRV